MKKLKLKNPTRVTNPMHEFMPREMPPPFIRGIETNDDERIYTFQNSIEPFKISVELPLEDYSEPAIRVTGKRIKPDILKRAIDFVTSNEFQFSEVFDENRDFPNRQKIGEKEFQENISKLKENPRS